MNRHCDRPRPRCELDDGLHAGRRVDGSHPIRGLARDEESLTPGTHGQAHRLDANGIPGHDSAAMRLTERYFLDLIRDRHAYIESFSVRMHGEARRATAPRCEGDR